MFSSSVLTSDAGGGFTIIQFFLVIIPIMFCIRIDADIKIIFLISLPDIRNENEGLSPEDGDAEVVSCSNVWRFDVVTE